MVTPIIARYLQDIPKSQKQSFLNQLSQLNPRDLKELESKISMKYGLEVQPQLDDFTLKSLGYDESQIAYMKGGMKHNYYQSGGEQQGNYATGDDSASYLESQYNQPLPQPTQSQLIPTANIPWVNGFRPSQPAYTPQEIESGIQQGVISNDFRVFHKDQPIVIDAKELNKSDKQVVKQAEGVKAIQQKLLEMGILKSEKDVDGVFGAKTEAAVKQFQEDIFKKSGQKLGNSDGTGDGIVGAKTKLALGVLGDSNVYKSNVRKALASIPKNREAVITNVPKPISNEEYIDENGIAIVKDPIKPTNVSNPNYSIVNSKPYANIKIETDSTKALLNSLKGNPITKKEYLNKKNNFDYKSTFQNSTSINPINLTPYKQKESDNYELLGKK